MSKEKGERSAAMYRSLVFAGAGLAVVAGVSAWQFYAPGTLDLPVPAKIVEAVARIVSIEGDVKLRRAGSLDWVLPMPPAPLQLNDLIRTRENAAAEILFVDGTRLNTRPESLVTIAETRPNPGSSERRVEPRIESGEVTFETGSRPATSIASPNSRTVPDPETEGRIQVDEGGTGLEIHRGGAEVETETGQHVRLAPNERVQIDPEGVAGPKTALPPTATVMDVPRPPGLLIRSVELRGDQLHLSGQTEPGVTMTVNGEAIEVQRDGSFNEHVVLEPGTAAVSIRAAGKTGAVTHQTLPIGSRR